jgi:hypothetical protein
VEPLGRGPTGLDAPPVIPGGGGGGGVAVELLDRGEIGAGVEEVPGVAAPQVVGRDASEAGTESASLQGVRPR